MISILAVFHLVLVHASKSSFLIHIIQYFQKMFDDDIFQYHINIEETFLFMQCRSKLDNWGGGGADIHKFVFTGHTNNRFQKKLITQNPNI
jgi:hypothetical protein